MTINFLFIFYQESGNYMNKRILCKEDSNYNYFLLFYKLKDKYKINR